VAYNIQTGNNKTKLLAEYESVTQNVLSLAEQNFLITFSYSVSSFVSLFPL
jgi:hypothetical protein